MLRDTHTQGGRCERLGLMSHRGPVPSLLGWADHLSGSWMKSCASGPPDSLRPREQLLPPPAEKSTPCPTEVQLKSLNPLLTTSSCVLPIHKKLPTMTQLYNPPSHAIHRSIPVTPRHSRWPTALSLNHTVGWWKCGLVLLAILSHPDEFPRNFLPSLFLWPLL